ncbi:hypothetical protein FB451DRAFT_439678 [Mycena latifolia]|nr:hypothetical protein FB451DRAFT_439678 [Mycena latifolia]
MLTRAAFLFLCIWTFAAIVHGGVAGVVEWPQSSPGLLNGTYIAAGPDSWRELADYLDSNPEAHISRLLLSDSPGIASGSNATATESCQNISTLAHRILDHTSSSLTALSYLATRYSARNPSRICIAPRMKTTSPMTTTSPLPALRSSFSSSGISHTSEFLPSRRPRCTPARLGAAVSRDRDRRWSGRLDSEDSV